MQYVSELRIKTAHYLIAAFALVTSLSWNSSMQLLINKLFPLNSDEIYAKIIYSLFLTFLLIVLIKYLPSTTTELPKPTQKEIEKFSNPSLMNSEDGFQVKFLPQKKYEYSDAGYGFPFLK